MSKRYGLRFRGIACTCSFRPINPPATGGSILEHFNFITTQKGINYFYRVQHRNSLLVWNFLRCVVASLAWEKINKALHQGRLEDVLIILLNLAICFNWHLICVTNLNHQKSKLSIIKVWNKVILISGVSVWHPKSLNDSFPFPLILTFQSALYKSVTWVYSFNSFTLINSPLQLRIKLKAPIPAESKLRRRNPHKRTTRTSSIYKLIPDPNPDNPSAMEH